MSNIDKQALREEFQFMRSIYSDPADHERQLIYIAAEALLDELEAKDNRINRLEAIVAVAEQRNALMREWKRALKVPCDLVDDQVPVVIHGMVIRLERLKEAEDKLTAAEKRIAELEAREVILPQRMDPEGYHIDEAYMVAAEDGEYLDRDEVIEAMRTAGIRINGEG